MKISIAIIALLLVLQGVTLYVMGQPIISKTGEIMLWTSTVNGPENSQQISDWYTFSHIIHGFVFFWFLYALARKYASRFGAQVSVWFLAISAVILEGAWEILENSPFIIDRYREATLAVGYLGDSILNSIFDTLWMLLGFWLAYKYNWKIILGIIVIFELVALYTIRDNLTLNIIMLLYPLDAIRAWQMGS